MKAWPLRFNRRVTNDSQKKNLSYKRGKILFPNNLPFALNG